MVPPNCSALGVYRWTHVLRGGTGMGDFHVWLTRYVPLCILIGLWDLQS